jgi:molybdate transport system ATP-binding protein
MLNINIKKKLYSEQGIRTLAVDLTINDNEFVAFYGRSGAGKTTLLKILAGLVHPDEGRIIVDGETWFDSQKKINRETRQRKIGYVFQEYNLFPDMSVRRNIELACRDHLNPQRINRLLEMSDLTMLQNAKPSTLSGGQQQRVALIRALVSKPRILLMDEPLSALESMMRLRLQDLILELYRQYPVHTFLVSHDIAEVYKLARRVFVLDDGRVVRQGLPQEVFSTHSLSNKFTVLGEVVAINKTAVVNIVIVRVGMHLSRVMAMDNELQDIQVGTPVILAAKAFNPVIMKVRSTV